MEKDAVLLVGDESERNIGVGCLICAPERINDMTSRVRETQHIRCFFCIERKTMNKDMKTRYALHIARGDWGPVHTRANCFGYVAFSFRIPESVYTTFDESAIISCESGNKKKKKNGSEIERGENFVSLILRIRNTFLL